MSSFDSMDSGSSGSVNINEVAQKLRERAAIQGMQIVFEPMSERCFDRCVTRPGSKLDSGEEQCLNRCVDKFIGSLEHVLSGINKSQE